MNKKQLEELIEKIKKAWRNNAYLRAKYNIPELLQAVLDGKEEI